MPDITPGEVPFTEAIDFFKAKLNLPTNSWDEMVGSIHAKGFTVAGATKASLLEDLRGAVNAAIESGETIGDFRDRFDKIVAQHGWDYKGTRGWRSRVIYDTNLRTARMAGRWAQYQRVKARRPYLQYQTAGDERVRPEHATWDGTVLPIDSPWWASHYPPNGWGCRCTTRSLSERQLQREGKTVAPEPTVQRTDRVNPDTGEIFPAVPEGIDAGWNYNVGQAWLGPDHALAERVMSLPKPWRDHALRQATQVAADSTPSFAAWAERVIEAATPTGERRTAGWLSGPLIDRLTTAGTVPRTPLITASDADILKSSAHTAALDLPSTLATPAAILLDRSDGALLYVLDTPSANAPRTVARLTQGPDSHTLDSLQQIPTATLRKKSSFTLLQGTL